MLTIGKHWASLGNANGEQSESKHCEPAWTGIEQSRTVAFGTLIDWAVDSGKTEFINMWTSIGKHYTMETKRLHQSAFNALRNPSGPLRPGV